MDNETATETKKCPFCAEDVALLALKCKHCGEFFETTQRKVRQKTRIPALVVAALIFGAAVLALALNFWGDGGGDVAPGPAASTDAALDIAATAVPSPSPTPVYADFLQEISDKRWSSGNLPCELNGGAYQVFSSRRGYVWTAGGKEQIAEARSRFNVVSKDANSFVMKVEFLANDMVASNLGDPNAVSTRTTWTVRRSANGGIDYHKKIEMLNFDAMFRGIRRYDVKDEKGYGQLCRNQPTQREISSANVQGRASNKPQLPWAEFILTAEGLGPIKIGMSLSDLERETGIPLIGYTGDYYCDYWGKQGKSSDEPWLPNFLSQSGKLSRISISTYTESGEGSSKTPTKYLKIKTDRGARIGDSIEKIKKLYPEAIIQDGFDGSVDIYAWDIPDFSGIKFVTYDGKVVEILVGNGSIRYYEGCS